MRTLVNLVFLLPPISHLFALRRILLNFVGVQVSPGARINGLTSFYGHGPIHIGESTWLGPRCRFYSSDAAKISIGGHCDIAPEVVFLVGSHEFGDSQRRAGTDRCDDIIVENGCWIGARSTILGGVCIGHGTVVGAGSLVNKDLPANCVAAGVPAKPIRYFGADEYS